MNVCGSIFLIAVACLILLSCESREERKLRNKFDTSLDTLVKGTPLFATTVSVYGGDTLKGDPKKIEDLYYYRSKSDAKWVFSEKITVTFKDHNQIRFALETYDHDKTIVNTIFYEKEIDDEDLILKRKHYGNGDSSLYGLARWYDKKGNIVKAVQAISEEMRILKVFKYDSLNRPSETWERTIFTKNPPDSAYNNRTIKTEYLYKDGFNKPSTKRYSNKVLVDSTVARNDTAKIDWQFQYDQKGNWIRREAPDGLHYRERKIVY